MRHTLFSVLLSLAFTLVSAQKMNIEGFSADPSDITASVNRRLDGNGEACALVKVLLARSGASFQGDVVGQTVYSQSEYNVYMTKGAKRLDVKLDGLLPLSIKFADYGVSSLKELVTYRLVLTLPSLDGVKAMQQQKLIVDYAPVDAVFMLDGYPLKASNGHIEESIQVGEHRYLLALGGYVPDEGSVVIRENAPKRLNLELYSEQGVASDASQKKEVSNTNHSSSSNSTSKQSSSEDYGTLLSRANAAYDSKDYVLAKSLYEKAYAMNPRNDVANRIGEMYYEGYGVSQNYGEALKWFRKTAEKGDAQGQSWCGLLYQYGYGVTKDLKLAKGWYEKAAAQGYEYAIDKLKELDYGTILNRANESYNSKDYVLAKSLYENAYALNPQNDVANRIGEMFYNGYGVSQDYVEALKWFQKTAESGSAQGQSWCGLLYQYGYGVTKDLNLAKGWYEKAAAQGYKYAIDRLKEVDYGFILNQANAAYDSKDYVSAKSLYENAYAMNPQNDVANRIGEMFYNGYGVSQDYVEALKWFRKTAESGDAQGQSWCGLLYQYGYGVTKDLNQAKAWYEKAAAQGYEYAIKRLKELQ